MLCATVQFILEQSTKGGGEGRGVEVYSTLSLTSALDMGWRKTPRPGRFTPGKDPVPIVGQAG